MQAKLKRYAPEGCSGWKFDRGRPQTRTLTARGAHPWRTASSGLNTGKLTWTINIAFKIVHIIQGRLLANAHIKLTKNLFDSFILFDKSFVSILL